MHPPALRAALNEGYAPSEYPLLAAASTFEETIAPELLSAVSAFWSPIVPADGDKAPVIGADIETCEEFLERSVHLGLLTSAGPDLYRIHAAAKGVLREFAVQIFPDLPVKAAILDQFRLALGGNSAQPMPALAVVRTGFASAGRLQRGSVSPLANHEIGANPAVEVRRAFAHAIGDFGAMLASKSETADVIDSLASNEFNLLEALRIGMDNAWWSAVGGCLQGLGVLYDRQGRSAEWQQLLDRLEPKLCDPTTRLPNPDCGGVWRTWIAQSVRLERMRTNLEHAEDLQHLRVLADRRALASDSLTPATQDGDITGQSASDAELQLAESLHMLSVIRRDLGQSDPGLEDELIALADKNGANETAAHWARELGDSYSRLPELRDSERARRWYQRALELTPPHQPEAVAACLLRLGQLTWELFVESRRIDRPEPERSGLLREARQYVERAIEVAPAACASVRVEAYIYLGHVLRASNALDSALGAYREAARIQGESGDSCGAAATRLEMASALRGANRASEAAEHVRFAHAVFAEHTDTHGDLLRRAEELLDE